MCLRLSSLYMVRVPRESYCCACAFCVRKYLAMNFLWFCVRLFSATSGTNHWRQRQPKSCRRFFLLISAVLNTVSEVAWPLDQNCQHTHPQQAQPGRMLGTTLATSDGPDVAFVSRRQGCSCDRHCCRSLRQRGQHPYHRPH